MSRVFLLGHISEVVAQRGDWRKAKFCAKRLRTKQDEELFRVVGTNPYEAYETLTVRGSFPSASPLFFYVVAVDDSGEYERREPEGVRVTPIEIRRSIPPAEHEDDGADLPVCRFWLDGVQDLSELLATLELRETRGAGNSDEEEWPVFEKKRAAAIRKTVGMSMLQRALQKPDYLGETQLAELRQSFARNKFVRWDARCFFERVFWSHLHASVALFLGTEAVGRLQASECGRALLSRIATEPWLASMLDETQHRAEFFNPSTGSITSYRRRPVETKLEAIVELANMSDDADREREEAEELERCRIRWAIFEDLQSRMRGYGAVGSTAEEAERAKLAPSRESLLEALSDLERNGVLRLCPDHRAQPYFFSRVWDKDELLHGLISDLLATSPPPPRGPSPASQPVDASVTEFLRRAMESSLTLLSSRYAVPPLEHVQALMEALDSEAALVECDADSAGLIGCSHRASVEALISDAERHVSFELIDKKLTTGVFLGAHKVDSWHLHQAIRRLGESVARVVLVIDDLSRGSPSADLLNPNPCRALWNAGARVPGMACVEARRSPDAALSRTSEICLSVLAPTAPGPHVVTFDPQAKPTVELLYKPNMVILTTNAAEREHYTKAVLAGRGRQQDYPHRIACERDVFYFRRQRILATVSSYWFELRTGAIRTFSDAFDSRQIPAESLCAVFRARPLHAPRRESLIRVPIYDGRISGVEHGRAVMLHQLPPHRLPFVSVVCSEGTRSDHLYSAAEVCSDTLLLMGASDIERHRQDALTRRPYGAVTPLTVMLAAQNPPEPKRHKSE